MPEVEIVKLILRIDDSQREKPRAELVAFDKEGREYTFEPRYYDGNKWQHVFTDVICYEPSKSMLKSARTGRK